MSYRCVSWEITLHNKEQINWLCSALCATQALWDGEEEEVGGQSWETLCYVCHFTPHPFPRVHRNSAVCEFASSSRGSSQVEKAEAAFSCDVTFCPRSVTSSKVKLCIRQLRGDLVGRRNLVKRIQIWVDSFSEEHQEMTRIQVMNDTSVRHGTLLCSGIIFDCCWWFIILI